MAPTIVGVATQNGTGATLVCNKPTGTASGNLLLAWHYNDAGNIATSTPPSGWATNATQDQGINAAHFKLYSKTAGGSEGSTYTFNQSSVAGVITIIALSGVDVTAAHWVISTTSTANSASRVCPSLTGVSAGGVLLCTAMVDASAVAITFTAPSGMTKQSDVQSGTASAMSVASLLSPPNPTTTRTFTASSGNMTGSANGIQNSLFVPAASQGQFFSMW